MCQFSKIPDGYHFDLRAYNIAQIRAMHSAFIKWLVAEKWHSLQPPGLIISDEEAEMFWYKGHDDNPPMNCFREECLVDYLIPIE